MAKKALILLVTFFSILFIGANSVSAQDKDVPWGPSYDTTDMEAYKAAINDDNCATPSLECLVHQTSRFVAMEWVNSILYPGRGDGLTEDDGAGLNSRSAISTVREGGFAHGTMYLIGEMYRYPVARTSIYVADVLKNAHIITPAYAQGLGFASLNPVLELWKVFRNVSYMLFIIIFIVIGFMIMFRQKIGGQSAITAQQAIPSVIASLIFVTFSYAIAGFLIDLMYLVMFMILGLFGQTAPGLDAGIIDFNILELMGTMFGSVSGFGDNIDIVTTMLKGLTDTEALGATLGVIGGLTLSLVLAIAVLIGTFKLFFELLKSYATIILYVVWAPITLLAGAFPGNNAFATWIKNLVANLAAFPIVLLFVILFYQFANNPAGSGGFVPPFLLGGGQSGTITSLMGLAIILALPEIVKDIKKKLGATEGFGSMVFNAASSRAKEGTPLGTRAAALGAATGAGAVGFGERFIRSKGSLLGRTAAGVGGFKKRFNPVAQKGVRAAGAFSRSIGARQPDILNPITTRIDKRFDKEGAKKEEGFQAVEDIVQALRKKGGGGVG